MNTSATGGVLTPAGSPAPIQDDALDLLLQQLVTAITGLDGSLVRPRWQVETPIIPEPNTDWCAIGVMGSHPDAGPYLQHNSADPGSDTYIRHEDITVLASFYGPHAQSNVGLLRDGLAVPQNIETLTAQEMAFVESGPPRAAPELVNQQWVKRYDMSMRLRRRIVRSYPIENLVSTQVQLDFQRADDTQVDVVLDIPPGS